MDRQAIALAAQEVAAHPAVCEQVRIVVDADRAEIEFEIDLGFGDRWRTEGGSPTGTHPIETVKFTFDEDFPVSAPGLSLRPDFSREHAHIQPYITADGRPVPCVVNGPLNEFVAAQGFYGLVDQVWRWLQRAAEGSLAHGNESWEPMRRDRSNDLIFANLDQIDGLLRRSAGFAVLACAVSGRSAAPEERGSYLGRLGNQIAGDLIHDRLKDASLGLGRSVALVIWAEGQPEDDQLRVNAEYSPDQVTTIDDLNGLCSRLGMAVSLREGLNAIRTAAGGLDGVVRLAVILMVRRPRHLEGSTSSIEHAGYLLSMALPAVEPATLVVRPIACLDDLTPSLLRRLSGDPKVGAWGLLGAGSLGSKIAIHRARSGAAPEFAIDPGWLLAHNAARHGLHRNPSEELQCAWLDPKVIALADAIAGFSQKMTPVRASHRAILQVMADPETSRVDWLLNTTASTVVRDWLASPAGFPAPRGAEACLFDGGKLGYLAFEGAGRNPDASELMGAFYSVARQRSAVAASLYKRDGQLGTVRIGEGCDSLTMVMSDARLSTMASSMAELFAQAKPDLCEGQVHVLTRVGVELTHEVITVAAHHRVPLEGLDGWSVSLSPNAEAEIVAESAEYPDRETGGVLLGRVSTISRRIQVVATLAAPSDSIRSATEFVLGVNGLTDAIMDVVDDTAGALVCVGTWHSHLGPAAPSDRDYQSAGLVGQWEARPMAFLVYGMDGWRAVSAATPLTLSASFARGERGRCCGA